MSSATLVSDMTRFVTKSESQTDDTVERSTERLDAWLRILIDGGMRDLTRLRSTAGTFGKRIDRVKHLVDFIRWALRQRRPAKMKFPWYYMG